MMSRDRALLATILHLLEWICDQLQVLLSQDS